MDGMRGLVAMASTSDLKKDTSLALEALETALPGILGAVSIFSPQVAAFLKFLPTIEAAIRAVDTVAQAAGSSDLTSAQSTVIAHNTPGQPNAPPLSA